MQNKLSILFISTSIGHRTFRKTVRMMERVGCEVRLIGFSRAKYPESTESFDIIDLGSLDHGNYTKRSKKFIFALGAIRRQIKQHDLLHCFGLDSRLLASIAGWGLRKPTVYQVQDIRPVLIGESLKARFARSLERLLLKNVKRLVVSSHAYYTEHFRHHYKISEIRVTIIENKLEHDPLEQYSSELTPAIAEGVNIGYFGVLRCQRSWDILTRLVESDAQGRFALCARGVDTGLTGFDAAVTSISSISYAGPYRDPDDLDELYRNVHIVWAAYPFGYDQPGNWQWARTVRFYEACAYGIPVIVQKGTQDALFVQKHDIGLVVDMGQPSEAIALMRQITSEKLIQWRKNILSLPRSCFIHTDEYQKLYQELRHLASL